MMEINVFASPPPFFSHYLTFKRNQYTESLHAKTFLLNDWLKVLIELRLPNILL